MVFCIWGTVYNDSVTGLHTAADIFVPRGHLLSLKLKTHQKVLGDAGTYTLVQLNC